MTLIAGKKGIEMKERITIRKRGQVTLPKSFLDKFGLEEGDSLNLEINNQGEIVVVPMVQVPASQRWFWTKEWQECEREADKDIKANHIKRFDDDEDPIKWLNSAEADEWINEDS